jgi:hypothetical protein
VAITCTDQRVVRTANTNSAPGARERIVEQTEGGSAITIRLLTAYARVPISNKIVL